MRSTGGWRVDVGKDTHTPRRTVRLPDELWEAAKAYADEEGRTVTDVIEEGLRRYVAKRRRQTVI
jgi:hypothetical protein